MCTGKEINADGASAEGKKRGSELARDDGNIVTLSISWTTAIASGLARDGGDSAIGLGAYTPARPMSFDHGTGTTGPRIKPGPVVARLAL